MELSLPTQSCSLSTVATKKSEGGGGEGIFLLGGIISCLACKSSSMGNGCAGHRDNTQPQSPEWCPVRVITAPCSASALLLLFNISLQWYCFARQQKTFYLSVLVFPLSPYIYSWHSGKRKKKIKKGKLHWEVKLLKCTCIRAPRKQTNYTENDELYRASVTPKMTT